MKHNLPLGTIISVGSICYEVVHYQTLLCCDETCKHDHDCYEEPYITVRECGSKAFPISKINHVFDNPDGTGRPFNSSKDISNLTSDEGG